MESGREVRHFPAIIHMGGRPVLRVRCIGPDVTARAAPELLQREKRTEKRMEQCVVVVASG